MNAKELIQDTITKLHQQGYADAYIAQAILSLTYDCKCAAGKVFDECTLKMVTCPRCKGTGKGSPMIAVLAEDQTLPENELYSPKFESIEETSKQMYHSGYYHSQQDLWNQGWRRIKDGDK